MSSDDEPSCYPFRNPVPPSIYPFITSPRKTFSLLLEINASLPPLKRLPMEILLHVNKELHRENALWKEIRAIWTPLIENDDSFRDVVRIPSPFHKAKFDLDTMQYYISKEVAALPPQEISHSLPICRHTMASADFLYRLKCFFPEIRIGTHYQQSPLWAAVLRHNQTGLLLSFSENEWNVYANHYALYNRTGPDSSFMTEDLAEQLESQAIFSMDAVRLLNALFETVDGSRRMAYYHPVADADLPTGDERYISVPTEIPQRCADVDDDEDSNDEDIHYKARCIWKADDNWDYPITALDPDGNCTLLQDLKYDIQSRKIDCLNGTVYLTAVISSGLLLYRLLRAFCLQRCGKGDVNKLCPTNSVWQVRLVHRQTESYLVFMDDRGLFDIRAGTDVKFIMSDIRALVESLLQ